MAKIIGGTAASSMLVPDWNQDNPNRADYIKNKPDVAGVNAKADKALAEARRYKFDYDCNGVVDLNDASYLQKHIEDHEAYPIPSWCNADANGDGVVNEDDHLYVLYAVNFPAKYPGKDDTVPNYSAPQNVANALKGKVSGEAVSMPDVSPLEHSIGVKLASDTITDFSTVTLTKCGKNLLPYPYKETTKTKNGITITDNGDGSLTFKGTPTVTFDFYIIEDILLPVGTHTVSVGAENIAGVILNVVLNSRASGNWVRNLAQVEKTNQFVTFSVTDGLLDENKINIYFRVYANNEINLTVYPQIELGTTATEYEPFKEPETYSGTVKSVPSLYPTTTLLTDTAGVTITAEYNKDTNKVIESLVNAIISLGGNV